MNPADLMKYAEPIGILIGFLFTVFTLSYIFGDNALFRIAIHIFIGVASGYAAVVIVYNVFWQQLIQPLIQNPDPLSMLQRIGAPVLLGLWLMTKISPRLARLGNPVLGYLVGVGAATVIGGAVLGTIFPQATATIALFDVEEIQANNPQADLFEALASGSTVLVGVVTTLVYFHFGAKPAAGGGTRRQPWVEPLAQIGQIFIAVTLGVIFAGVYAAALAAFVERVHSIWELVWNWNQLIRFP